MDRQEKEQRERSALHPAAFKSAESAGRAVAERPDPWRTPFERDRDRIIHSSAFRRLEYKTQVFVNHVGDHHRTRLTHSLEVVQVARSLAGALDLNEALVEAIALAHDLGHPPYGHAGEKLLDEKMKDFGGFSHNRQSLRVVDVLERRSPDYKGLNLSFEVKQSLRKHEALEDPRSGERLRFPLLEAQLVDHADSTAYHYHDLDDGLRAAILDPEKMARELPIWERAVAATEQRHPGLARDSLFWRRATNEVLGMTIADLQSESERRLEQSGCRTPRAAQVAGQRLIGHSEEFRGLVAQLHEYLYANMYFQDAVSWHVRRATDLLGRVVDALLAQPGKVPARFHEDADTPQRAVCDYVAGMTDRYVERVARELGVLPY